MRDGPPDRQRILADAARMEAIAAGDGRIFTELVRAETSRLVSLAAGLLASRAEAEEVAQDALLRLWQQAPDWTAGARISTWLHRVTYRLCIDRLRRRRPSVPVAEIEDTMADGSDSPEDTLLRGQQAALIDAALGRLPPRQRAAILLAHGRGLGQAEAAAVLELSEEAYESLLARGRRRLKELVRVAEMPAAGDTDEDDGRQRA